MIKGSKNGREYNHTRVGPLGEYDQIFENSLSGRGVSDRLADLIFPPARRHSERPILRGGWHFLVRRRLQSFLALPVHGRSRLFPHRAQARCSFLAYIPVGLGAFGHESGRVFLSDPAYQSFSFLPFQLDTAPHQDSGRLPLSRGTQFV